MDNYYMSVLYWHNISVNSIIDALASCSDICVEGGTGRSQLNAEHLGQESKFLSCFYLRDRFLLVQ